MKATEQEMLKLLREYRAHPASELAKFALTAAILETDFSAYRKFRSELADMIGDLDLDRRPEAH